MTKAELIDKLKSLHGKGGNLDENHQVADNALLEYINDPEVRAAFDAIEKWYS